MPAVQHSVTLPDRYRVTRRIASGGMATVYACEDQVLGRLVAVKVLAPHYADDGDAAARFQREARAAARVSDHPHVVTIYDIGEYDGTAFIVMEYFPGGTVADRLRSEDPIPSPTAVRWLEEAASALDHAHQAGIVHRDVKPANLLLDGNGRLAVADFGIARMASDVNVTSTGVVLGTAAYLSPEQALGEPATAASDRYSLTVLAYELLTRRRPFEAENPAAQARAHVETPPPRASDVDGDLPEAVDRVLARGMDKEPDHRWPTACAMVEALENALGHEAEPATPEPATAVTAPRQALARRREPTPTPPPVRRSAAAAPPPRRRAWGPVLVAAVILGLLAGGAIAALSGGGDGGTSDNRASTAPAKKKAKSKATTQAEPAQTSEAPAQTTSTPAQPASTGTEKGALASQGHAALTNGDYETAVETLREATRGCPVTRTDPCAYALYDLGVALRKSGDPDAAVSVLEQRLQNPDQKAVVQAELDRARAEAGKS